MDSQSTQIRLEYIVSDKNRFIYFSVGIDCLTIIMHLLLSWISNLFGRG
jgi:hypothetical protein